MEQAPVSKDSRVRVGSPIPKRIVRIKQVKAITGLGRSMIYRLEAQARFPQRVLLSERAVGWIEEEVEQWVEARAEKRVLRKR